MSEPSLSSGALRKVFAIARFEFLATVLRPGYLVSLLGMPLFVGAIALLSGLVTSKLMVQQLTARQTIGLFDETGLFANAPLVVAPDLDLEKLPPHLRAQIEGNQPIPTSLLRPTELRRFADLPSLTAALRTGELLTAIHLPKDWLATGLLEEIAPPRAGLSLSATANSAERRLRPWLVRGLLESKVDPAVLTRVLAPSHSRRLVLGPDGSLAPRDLLAELKPFAVPLGFVLLLLLSIFTSAGYLATGLAEEKQNRALEFLLTAVTPEQLFWGKLCGLGGAALLQFLLYLGVIGLPVSIVFAALGLQLAQALIGLCYFLGGFTFFGALLLAVGSLGNSTRYTQQLAGLVTFTAMLPMLILPVLLEQPSGALARVLTFVPFTAPLTGMLRAGAGALPLSELALSLFLLGAGAFVSVRLSSRIFRVGLLSAGGQVPLKTLWSWLRAP